MSVSAERGKRFVKVKDSHGNEWLCPLDAMKKVKDATQEELDDCVELDEAKKATRPLALEFFMDG